MSAPSLRILVVAGAALWLAACGSTPPAEPARADAAASAAEGDEAAFDAPMTETGEPVPPLTDTEKSVECRYERVTGSHMMRKVCMTAAERRREEEASKQWMRTRGRSGGVSRVRDAADPRDDDDER